MSPGLYPIWVKSDLTDESTKAAAVKFGTGESAWKDSTITVISLNSCN